MVIFTPSLNCYLSERDTLFFITFLCNFEMLNSIYSLRPIKTLMLHKNCKFHHCSLFRIAEKALKTRSIWNPIDWTCSVQQAGLLRNCLSGFPLFFHPRLKMQHLNSQLTAFFFSLFPRYHPSGTAVCYPCRLGFPVPAGVRPLESFRMTPRSRPRDRSASCCIGRKTSWQGWSRWCQVGYACPRRVAMAEPSKNVPGAAAACPSGFRCDLERAGCARQDDIPVPVARLPGPRPRHRADDGRRRNGHRWWVCFFLS